MKYLNLKFLALFVIAITVFSCERDGDDTNTPLVVDFGTAPSASLITKGDVTVITENTVRYHTFDFGTAPYTVTVVETENNIVLVDLGAEPAYAEELKTYTDAINKPGSVIITHNHGDHFGGAGVYKDLTFYAESTVAEQLNSADDFTALNPNAVMAVTGSKSIGGLTFTFGKVSNAETGENGYVYCEDLEIVFSGDLVYNLSHPYVREYTPKEGEDEIDNWIAGLNILKAKFADYKHLFVGHNGSRSDVGTAIDENIAYLQTVKGLINGTKNLTGGGTAASSQDVVDELKVLYPNYKEAGLLLSLPEAFFPGDTGADWF